MKARTKLRIACQEAKILLTAVWKTDIIVEALYDGEDFSYELRRGEFELICQPIFDRCFPPMEKAITDAGFQKEDIDEIILVGGSSRISQIETRLEQYFGKAPNKQLNPDEAVCQGATLYAAKLSGDPAFDDMVFKDVTPMALGTEIESTDLEEQK